MPKFQVSLKRTETWLADIVIEADSAEAARERIEKTLDEEGWDAVYNDEGIYEECISEVADVLPCVAEDADGHLRHTGSAPDRTAPSVPDNEKTIPVTFTCVGRHGGKTYRAGGMYLSLGGGPGIGHVAMRVDPGGKKWATTDDAAAAWLTEQGLPADRAARLVADAIQARDCT
jgi:hypothetical protein